MNVSKEILWPLKWISKAEPPAFWALICEIYQFRKVLL